MFPNYDSPVWCHWKEETVPLEWKLILSCEHYNFDKDRNRKNVHVISLRTNLKFRKGKGSSYNICRSYIDKLCHEVRKDSISHILFSQNCRLYLYWTRETDLNLIINQSIYHLIFYLSFNLEFHRMECKKAYTCNTELIESIIESVDEVSFEEVYIINRILRQSVVYKSNT